MSAPAAVGHVGQGINALCRRCHAVAKTCGWWEAETPATSKRAAQHKGALIALMHSELSEAHEGMKSPGTRDNKLPMFLSLEVEIADLLIRIFDYAGGYDRDIGRAVEDHLAVLGKTQDTP